MTDIKDANYYQDMYEMLRHDYGELLETHAKARIKANKLSREYQKSYDKWADLAIRDAQQIVDQQKELDDIKVKSGIMVKQLNAIDAAMMRCPISGIYDTFSDAPDALDQMAWHIKELTEQNKKLRADITQWRAWYPTVHMEVGEMPNTVKEVDIVIDEMDIPQYCGVCGRTLQVVRPGKWQCDYCDDKFYESKEGLSDA